MLGELVSTLAHELNQPLTAILSNAQAAPLPELREPRSGGAARDPGRHRARRQTGERGDSMPAAHAAP
ncbi:MAG: hypothetical protein N838_22435 [Thiohalocapsa sp. PB-PSB1]|nr:hypothetical protein [Desulfofustis sp. PB-SRB1]QQO55694.1 MAG: hypothetical protein N838_22435 [Thiohalocapsa sp. PB-PSB1]